MGKSSSNDELTIRNQFDRICKLALKGEAADYYRHIAYRQKHEVLFSELSQKELDSIFGVDKYTVENKCFRVLGYDIEVKDTLLAEAIQSLSENKRKVVLLSYRTVILFSTNHFSKTLNFQVIPHKINRISLKFLQKDRETLFFRCNDRYKTEFPYNFVIFKQMKFAYTIFRFIYAGFSIIFITPAWPHPIINTDSFSVMSKFCSCEKSSFP